ncbi:unnamed protein product, partial [marine sediment metagenome]
MKSLTWLTKVDDSPQDRRGDGYNPHLNVLVPYGFIIPGKMNRIKQALR